jgi:hypothetical protein
MLEYILATVLLISAYLAYTFYLKPVRLIRHYEELLRKLGYKVHVCKFKLFGSAAIDKFSRDT